jgi:hypothetical protein
MSRILKRPMFRTGGTPNEGIMHGLVDRKNYNIGTRVEEITAAMDKYAPIPKSRFPLGSIGLNLVSGEYAGDGLLQNIARSARGPYEQFTQADDARAQALAQRKASAVGVAVSEQAGERMQMLKNMGKKADISKIQSIANELQKHNPLEYPDTAEGRAAAWNKAFEASETSPAPHPKTRYDKLWSSLVSGGMIDEKVAKNKASWSVYIEDNVIRAKNEQGESIYGGEVPTYSEGKGVNQKDFVDATQMEPGKVYWDDESGELYEVVEEDGELVARAVPGWREKYDSRLR